MGVSHQLALSVVVTSQLSRASAMSYAYLFKYIIIGDTGEQAWECTEGGVGVSRARGSSKKAGGRLIAGVQQYGENRLASLTHIDRIFPC